MIVQIRKSWFGYGLVRTYNGCTKYSIFFNQFVPNAPILYPLKTTESFMVFCFFQVAEKGYIGNKWIHMFKVLEMQA